jgi:hypothetical protein
MTITIPDELRAKAEERAKRYGFASVEEYVMDFLEGEDDTVVVPPGSLVAGYPREELEKLLMEGINSGNPVKADENYWNALREKIRTGTLRRAERPS